MSIIDIIIIALPYFAASITAAFPSIISYANLLVIVVLLYVAYKDKLVCMAPLFLFFNSTILYFSGFAIADLFFALFIANELYRRPRICRKHVHAIFFVFILYGIIVVSYYNVMLSIEIALIFIFVFFLLQYIERENAWKCFASWYLVGLFSATLYGLATWSNNMDSGQTRRFMLAFTDPNYAGMFLSIGLYIVLYGDLRNKILKFVFLVTLTTEILLTMSSTAILCNLIIALILITDKGVVAIKGERHKININQLLGYSIAIAMLVAAIYFTQKGQNSILSDSIDRFIQKISGMSTSLSASTTGRSDVWEKHLRIFQNGTGILGKLFGGFFITDRGFDPRYFTIVSHEVYVDSLLCFGLVGTGIYVATILKQIILKWRMRNVSKTNKQLFCIVMVWLIYSFGLSMFPFWGFTFMLLISVQERRDLRYNE